MTKPWIVLIAVVIFLLMYDYKKTTQKYPARKSHLNVAAITACPEGQSRFMDMSSKPWKPVGECEPLPNIEFIDVTTKEGEAKYYTPQK